MTITQEIFEAFLRCRTKSYLYSNGAVGTRLEFSEWEQHVQKEFKEKGWRQLHSTLRADEWYQGTPSSEAVEQRRYRFIFDFTAATAEIRARLHGLELTRPRADDTGHHAYMPIHFVPSEKLETSHKLLLGFDALAISRASGKMPRVGKIIHGRQCTTVTVPLAPLVDKVRSLLASMAAQGPGATSPPVVLNRHCAQCEFQARCRQIAIEKDDLSLLPSISEKERRKQQDKGIFTVTQLSYTFRPRRHSAPLTIKHQPALKALAIRKNQIHIFGTLAVSAPGTPVYFDVEGDPDREFYYLIGLRTGSTGSSTHYSFWANDRGQEQNMWADCLHTLSAIDNRRLVHYGSYDMQFLKRMRTRYPNVGNSVFLERLMSSAVNLLSVIYPHVYFPTYSNGLKEVARYLGFRWSDSTASGLTTLAWRSQWESSHDPDLKQKLLTYNAEDCEALEAVFGAVAELCQGRQEAGTPGDSNVVYTDCLKHGYQDGHLFGKIAFALPDLEQINQAAYWDYQRDRIYIRSSQRLKRLSRDKTKRVSKPLPVNKAVTCHFPVPSCCPRCKATKIRACERYSKIVRDLKFTRSGIKRWIVKYSFDRYLCPSCQATFLSQQRPWTRSKYGPDLVAYLLYNIIELRFAQRSVTDSLNRLFGLQLLPGSVNSLKARAAQFYRDTYSTILKRITGGILVHADETKISVEGKDAFVWVLTNLEEVVYFYSPTREGRTIEALLQGFTGVLVSDFYAAYESIQCPQQKCLIHLIRDLNDDLLKQPFDEELKEFAREFAALLRAIVETIDQFGLKTRFLRRHLSSVEQFYERLAERDYRTDVGAKWKRRFEKNRDKLFTFLKYDGIPWNNNNAEHAIKAVAKLRRTIGGTSSEKGIGDYVTLLSICQTCHYKGASFLDFLRSGETDVDEFLKKTGHSRP
jgi:predicted RecB family nuclease